MTDQHTPDVSVLVVGFNSSPHLERCITAIENSIDGICAETLFINNGTDQSEVRVLEQFPWVRVIESQGNVGFAAANNLLAKAAKGRHLLLVNPDTKIDVRAVELLLEAMEDEPDFGILGGTTFLNDDSSEVFPQLQIPTTLRLLSGIFVRRTQSMHATNQTLHVDACSGGFMMVRRTLWEELDGMDERFFLYAEDLDFCKRANTVGAKIGHVPQAEILHDVGSGEFFSASRQLLQAKGNATYHWKHSSPFVASTKIALVWVRIASRMILSAPLAPFSRKYRRIFSALAPLATMPWKWAKGY